MNDYLSKFGTILKRETLASASLLQKTGSLVLLSNDPYPGYYCSEEHPADNSCKAISYYIPLKEHLSVDIELTCRISLELQNELEINICAAYFNFENTFIRAFRLKEIEKEQLPDIIEKLKSKGLKLYRHKKVKSFLSYIRIKNFFEIEQIDAHLFKNSLSDKLYYFSIPEKMRWEQFEQMITFQKLNSSFKNFDAAIGFWIEKPRFTDFVRIYTIDPKLKTLKEIQKDFLSNVTIYEKQGMLI